jgi:CheY-like chemotaxis protein
VTLVSQPGSELVEVRFAVEDTGIGIPADRLHRLFQSFSQVDATTTRKYGGTGLGLAICKRLAELLGGRIEVDSEPGKGSHFIFTIRASQGALPGNRAMPPLEAVLHERTLSELAGRCILIVEDQPASRRALERQIEQWGCVVRTAAGRSEALVWIDLGQRFDVAIIDAHLPGANGDALAAELRRRLGNAVPSCIALAALSRRRQTDDHELFAASVTKPIKASRLLQVLTDVLSPPTSAGRPAAPAPVAQDSETPPLRILVAEDNIVNQKVAVAMIAQLGYRADLVANGLEAVEAVRRIPYDVVFMDLQMPELDGLEAMRQIRREHDGGRRPYIIALTANAFDDSRAESLVAGMDDYLSKPLQRDQLRDALERARHARKASSEAENVGRAS